LSTLLFLAPPKISSACKKSGTTQRWASAEEYLELLVGIGDGQLYVAQAATALFPRRFRRLIISSVIVGSFGLALCVVTKLYTPGPNVALRHDQKDV